MDDGGVRAGAVRPRAWWHRPDRIDRTASTDRIDRPDRIDRLGAASTGRAASSGRTASALGQAVS
jgi:hypothetical protein